MKSNMCMTVVISSVADGSTTYFKVLMLCHITAGRATIVTADILAKCGRWNNNILECLILLP